MKGKTKRVVNFFVMRSAFTRGNTSAIGLVVLMVVGYSLLSGRPVKLPPKLDSGENFGSAMDYGMPLDNIDGLGADGKDVPSNPVKNNADLAEAQSVIGALPSEGESARLKQIDKRGRLFDPDTPEEDGEDGKAVNHDGLVQGVEVKSHREEWMMLRSEKRKVDSLAAIEDRLDVKRARKKHLPASTGDPN